jgi:serine/threonine protein kinase
MDEAQTRPLPACIARRPTIAPAGQVVAGRYRLRRLLGQAAWGMVWRADDQALRRPVAAKQLHPAMVRVYDLAEEAGDPWIVMEALTGGELGRSAVVVP